MTIAGVFDIIGAVAFILAAVFSAMTLGSHEKVSRLAGALMTGAFTVLAFVMISNTLEHLGVTASLDAAEDFVEVIFFPLFAYALYVMSADAQLQLLKSTARAVQAEHDMVMSIIDSATVAIVMVDTRGAVNFSNKYAEEEFGIYEIGGHEQVSTAVLVPDGAPADAITAVFDVRIVGATLRDARWDVVSGSARTPLLLSATPMYARTGDLAGAVVVFTRARLAGLAP